MRSRNESGVKSHGEKKWVKEMARTGKRRLLHE